jgi:uncharacterized DUF497 family protein
MGRGQKPGEQGQGVSFELAQLVFDDPLHLSVPDRNGHGEERWQAIGLVGSVWLLLVIHT